MIVNPRNVKYLFHLTLLKWDYDYSFHLELISNLHFIMMHVIRSQIAEKILDRLVTVSNRSS